MTMVFTQNLLIGASQSPVASRDSEVLAQPITEYQIKDETWSTTVKKEKDCELKILESPISLKGDKILMSQKNFEEVRTSNETINETKIEDNVKTYPQTNQLLFCANNILRTVWRHKDAWPFRKPVDPIALNIPDYFKIISHPMDFETIKKKLKCRIYESAEQCVSDFRLTFENCKRYNPSESEIIKMCRNVEVVFEERLKQLPVECIAVPLMKENKKKKFDRKVQNAGINKSEVDKLQIFGNETIVNTNVPPIIKNIELSTPISKSTRSHCLKPTEEKDVSTMHENIDLKDSTNSPTSNIKSLGVSEPNWNPINSIVRKREKKRKSTTVYVSNSGVTSNNFKNDNHPIKPKLTKKLYFCKKILQMLFSKKYQDIGWPFYKPVNAELLHLSDYHKVIKNPMDLSLIKKKFENREYNHPYEFERDINLVFRNCRRYNPLDSDIYQMCRKLQDVFEEAYAMLPEESDCDDQFQEKTSVLNSTLQDLSKLNPKNKKSSVSKKSKSDLIEQKEMVEKLERIEEVVMSLHKQVTSSSALLQSKQSDSSNTKIKSNLVRKTDHNNRFNSSYQTTKSYKSTKSFPHGKKTNSSVLSGNDEKELEVPKSKPMSASEQRQLAKCIHSLPKPHVKPLLQIIKERIPSLVYCDENGKEAVQLDISSLDPTTLRLLDEYVKLVNSKKEHSISSNHDIDARRMRKGDSSDSSSSSVSSSGSDFSDSSSSSGFESNSDEEEIKLKNDSIKTDNKDKPNACVVDNKSDSTPLSNKLASLEEFIDSSKKSLLSLNPTETSKLQFCSEKDQCPSELESFILPASKKLSEIEVKVSNASAWGEMASFDYNVHEDSKTKPELVDDVFSEFRTKAIENRQKTEEIKKKRLEEEKERLANENNKRLEEERIKTIEMEKKHQEELEKKKRDMEKQRRREEERQRRQNEIKIAESENLSKLIDIDEAFS